MLLSRQFVFQAFVLAIHHGLCHRYQVLSCAKNYEKSPYSLRYGCILFYHLSLFDQCFKICHFHQPANKVSVLSVLPWQMSHKAQSIYKLIDTDVLPSMSSFCITIFLAFLFLVQVTI